MGRTFGTVWFGQLISQIGTAMTGFAMSIFVFQETGSVTRLGIMLLGVNLPGILLAPLAGAYIDRKDRRTVMLVADTVAGFASAGLAVLFFNGSLQYWHILVAVVVSSAAAAFQEPAYRAALPTLVPTSHLGRANGLVELAPAVGTLLAPAVAGALLLFAGVGAVLAVDFATFLVAAATLATVRFPSVASAGSGARSLRREIQEGFRYLAERGGLLGLLGIFAALNLVLTFANVLWIPVFLAFTNEAALGTLLSLVGLAMVAGSVVMSTWGGPKRRVMGLLGFMAVGGLALAVAGLRPSVWVAGAGALGLMFVVPIVNGTSQTLWQLKVSHPMQGRVFSTRRMVAQIATPVGFLADRVFEPLLLDGGRLVPILGPIFGTGPGRGSALLIALAGLVVVVVAGLAWASPTIRHLERDIPDVVAGPDPVA